MKILFVINDLESGGAQRVFLNLLEKIKDKEEIEIDLFLINKSGIYLKDIPDSIKINYMYSTQSSNRLLLPFNWFNRKCSRFLMKYFTDIIYKLKVKKKYDLEISYIESDASLFLGNSKKRYASTKRIAWIHTDLLKNNIGNHYLKALEKMDYLISVSKKANESACKVLKFDKEKIITLSNIVDGSKIEELSEHNIKYIKEKKVLLAVGRLATEKGFDRLINIFSNIDRNNNSWELIIIGEGPERQKLEDMIKKLNLNEKVKLLGFIENPYPYFKLADIVVLSSYVEGLPTVLSEAILLEKPIVSTKCAGVNEILLDGRLGMISENNDDDLCFKIESMIKSEDLQEKYKYACKKYKYLYNCDYNLNKTIELFKNIVSGEK